MQRRQPGSAPTKLGAVWAWVMGEGGGSRMPFIPFCKVWIISEVRKFKSGKTKLNEEHAIWMQKDLGWNPGFPLDWLCTQAGVEPPGASMFHTHHRVVLGSSPIDLVAGTALSCLPHSPGHTMWSVCPWTPPRQEWSLPFSFAYYYAWHISV